MNEIIISVLLVTGSLLCVVAAIGLVRLPDVFTRMHASTKAGTLGVGLVMLALAIASGEASIILKAIATYIFLVLTAPVAAHMLGRAAYRHGETIAPQTICDEWKDKQRIIPRTDTTEL